MFMIKYRDTYEAPYNRAVFGYWFLNADDWYCHPVIREKRFVAIDRWTGDFVDQWVSDYGHIVEPPTVWTKT